MDDDDDDGLMNEEDALRLFEALMDCIRERGEGPAQDIAQGVLELLVMSPTCELDSLRYRGRPIALESMTPQWEASESGPD